MTPAHSGETKTRQNGAERLPRCGSGRPAEIGLKSIAGKIPKRAALDGALGDDGALCEPC